jgi:integrase
VNLLDALRKKKGTRGKPLSKNTILNIYINLVTMFADAEQQGYTIRTPCAGLRKSQRPRKPTRAEIQGVAFTAEQVSFLISDERIPEDRQMQYALQFLSGTRFGETSGLRWKDYDPNLKPLGLLRVERQYEGRPLKGKRGEGGPPRDVPVHPTLAAMLAEWRMKGFCAFLGRHPKPEDFIVPSESGGYRNRQTAAYRLVQDCELVGIPKERTHVARRTFITLAMAGGASEAWVRRITHNASGDVLTGYQVNDWPAMCKAVLCVRVIRQRRAQVVKLARTGTESGGGTDNETDNETENESANGSIMAGIMARPPSNAESSGIKGFSRKMVRVPTPGDGSPERGPVPRQPDIARPGRVSACALGGSRRHIKGEERHPPAEPNGPRRSRGAPRGIFHALGAHGQAGTGGVPEFSGGIPSRYSFIKNQS